MFVQQACMVSQWCCDFRMKRERKDGWVIPFLGGRSSKSTTTCWSFMNRLQSKDIGSVDFVEFIGNQVKKMHGPILNTYLIRKLFIPIRPCLDTCVPTPDSTLIHFHTCELRWIHTHPDKALAYNYIYESSLKSKDLHFFSIIGVRCSKVLCMQKV
jgi:hypothetical protein